MKFRYILSASVLMCAPFVMNGQSTPNSQEISDQQVHSLAKTLERDQDDLENFRDHKQKFESAVEENNMGEAKAAHAEIIADMRQELTQERGKLKTSGSSKKATDIHNKREKLLDRQEEIMNKLAELRIQGAANEEGQLQSMMLLLQEYEGLMEQQIGLVKKEINMDVKEVEKK